MLLDLRGVTGKKGNRNARRRVQSPFPHDEVCCQVPRRPARAQGGRVRPDCAQGVDEGASFTLSCGHGHTIGEFARRAARGATRATLLWRARQKFSKLMFKLVKRTWVRRVSACLSSLSGGMTA